MNFPVKFCGDGDRRKMNGGRKIRNCRGARPAREINIDHRESIGSAESAKGARIVFFKNKKKRKVYTRTGDRGRCSLLAGDRAMKDADEVEAFGDIDELNSVLGVLLIVLPENALLSGEIERIQRTLFLAGSLVAAGPDSIILKRLEPITPEHIQSLELSIDAMEDRLPDIQRFIIPGGDASAAYAHLARSVCRRAERRVVKNLNKFNLRELPETIKNVLSYLNRLSDYLFVLGRFCNLLQNAPEKFIGEAVKST